MKKEINKKATLLFVLAEESRLLEIRLRHLGLILTGVYKKACERSKRRDEKFWVFVRDNDLSLDVVGSKRDLGMSYTNYKPLEKVKKRRWETQQKKPKTTRPDLS